MRSFLAGIACSVFVQVCFAADSGDLIKAADAGKWPK